MTESQLYEKIGRLQLAVDDRSQQYMALLQLLADVISGTIEASRVMVNLTDQSWIYSEAGTQPAVPPTINGLPNVVVGLSVPKHDGNATIH